jgi:hypothetical protein
MVKLQMMLSRCFRMKFNLFYIGLAKDGQSSNFLVFRPKKGFYRFEPRLKNTPETQEFLASANLDVMDYDSRWGRYRIRLQPGDIEKSRKVLIDLVAMAYAESQED